MAEERTVLFVCVGNAGRSMMAEAIFNQLGPKGWRAISAGVSPAREINPHTGPILSDIGVEPPPHPPQRLTQQMVGTSAIQISIGAIDHPSCPAWFRESHPRRWEVPNPQHFGVEGFREIREAIRAHVDALTAELGSNESQRGR